MEILQRGWKTTFDERFVISEIKKKNQNPKLSGLYKSVRSSQHTQDLLPTTQHHHAHEPTHVHPQEKE